MRARILKPESIMSRAVKGDTQDFFKGTFYVFMMIICYVDIVVAAYIIDLTEWSAFNSVNASKMILSLAGVKIISEIDDLVASWYIKFFIKTTEDGFDLLKY